MHLNYLFAKWSKGVVRTEWAVTGLGQQDVPSRHTINVSCHHRCCMALEESTCFSQLAFSGICHVLVLNHSENGENRDLPSSVFTEKLKNDNAERPAECFTTLRLNKHRPAHFHL